MWHKLHKTRTTFKAAAFNASGWSFADNYSRRIMILNI